MMLAAVMTDTVADPTETRRSDAITHPITSGESWKPAHRLRDRRVDVGDYQDAAESAARADDEAGRRRSAAAIPPRT